MKIGIIGPGKVGGTLAMLWASHGHEIMFGARDPQNTRLQTILGAIESRARAGSIREAALFGEVLLSQPGQTRFIVRLPVGVGHS